MKCVAKYKRIIDVDLKMIYYFKADGNNVYCITENGEYEVKESISLGVIATKYKQLGMIRVNKSMIVNIGHVKAVSVGLYGRRILVMRNKDKVVVNRVYRREFISSVKGVSHSE